MLEQLADGIEEMKNAIQETNDKIDELYEENKVGNRIMNAHIDATSEKTSMALRRQLMMQDDVIKQLSKKIDTFEVKGLGRSQNRMSMNNKRMSITYSERDNMTISTTSASRSRSNLKQSQEDNSLDAINIGDQILLNAAELIEAGYLHGDLATLRVGMQEFDVETNRDALSFNDYVFRVCPPLNHRYQNELDMAIATKEGKLDGKLTTGATDADVAFQILKKGVAYEEEANSTLMEKASKGETGGVVKYGDVIQLQHVNSGGFLNILKSPAPVDRECLGATLNKKSSGACWFKFTPRLKFQTDGSIVYYSHSVRLESVKQQGFLVHISPIAYSPIPHWRNRFLPRSLQCGKIFEANFSAEINAKTVFKVSKYSRFTVDDALALRTSAPFRLYHSQSESFFQASCDPDKGHRKREAREDDDLSHVPYLKKLTNLLESPDPTDPEHQTPKSVWCFEPFNRTHAQLVGWDTKVRVRHVPSGRYLAVDTYNAVKEDRNEIWFQTFLVDDATHEEDSTATCEDDDTGADAGSGNVIETVLPSQMIFSVVATSVSNSDLIPKTNVSIQLEHSYVLPDGTSGVLYLHNTEELKRVNSTNISNKKFKLVFSSVKQTTDVFFLMSVTDNEADIINLTGSLRRHCDLYFYSLKNPSVPINSELMKETGLALLTLFAMLKNTHHKFDDQFDKNKDWIEIANSMLPNAFSALFTFKSHSFIQRICREMKLMDSLFDMGTAAYLRSTSGDPWSAQGLDVDEGIVKARGIQKLVHVGLQLCVNNNRESQKYFGRRSSGKRLWMTILMEQLEDPLGSTLTLARLLVSNADMMRRYATPDLILRFLYMIWALGPQPRLTNFLEAICTVDGKTEIKNQEMILRLTWMNEENRSKTYLSTSSIDIKKNPCKPSLPTLPPVTLPSGHKSTNRAATKLRQEYIGKEVYESDTGFHPVFVRWRNTDEWTCNMDELFWSPKELGIPSYQFDRDEYNGEWCRIEDLCWVLEPVRLCEAVTGQNWNDFKNRINNDRADELRMDRKIQLAHYYVQQLVLVSKLCAGRSLNCIHWMQWKGFTYEMICSMCYNVHLPAKLRAVASSLCKNLFLDRYPQLVFCGKPSLPERLWVYEMVGKSNISVVKPLKLSDDDSLAQFVISPCHKFHKHPNPFFGFSTTSKFFLLQNMCEQYLEGLGVDGSVVHSHFYDNMLTYNICEIMSDLVSFGFQSSYNKIESTLRYLVPILDGRTDLLSDDEPFEPLVLRFYNSTVSPQVTGLKAIIIDSLVTIETIIANFRLALLMEKFKEYNSDSRLQSELQKIHTYVLSNTIHEYEGDITDSLFNAFDSLFTSGDGGALNFEVLSGGMDVDIILLDCLMYDDDTLFAKALGLLNSIYGQRRKLIDSFGEVTLLDSEETVPIDDITAELNYLNFLVSTSFIWGSASRLSGPFDVERYNTVLMSCEKINSFLYQVPVAVQPSKNVNDNTELTSVLSSFLDGQNSGADLPTPNFKSSEDIEDAVNPNRLHQDILRSLSLHTTLIDALYIDYNYSFINCICSPEDKIESRRMLVHAQSELIGILPFFVKGNPKNQGLIFSHLQQLRKHLGPLKLPDWPPDFSDEHKEMLPTGPGMNAEEVIIECLRDNWVLCERSVPQDLLEDFGIILENEPDPSVSDKLDLFGIVCQPVSNSPAIPRNQKMVVDVLLSESFSNVKQSLEEVFSVDISTKTSGMKPENILRVLTSTMLGENLVCATELQAKRFTILRTINALEGLLQKLLKNMDLTREREEEVIYGSGHWCALLEFLANQMSVLVLDGKLFRMEETWHILCVGINRLLSAIVKNVVKMNDKLAYILTCACDVAFVIIDGARAIGLKELMSLHTNEIGDADNSVFKSARILASHSSVKQFPIAQLACGSLVELLSKSSGVTESSLLDISNDLDEEDEGGIELSTQKVRFEKSSWQMESVKHLPPAEMAKYFYEAVSNNTRIRKKLHWCEFDLVNLLEEASGCITWKMIVRRMVQYMKDHNNDEDESTCSLILRVFLVHLLKSRSQYPYAFDEIKDDYDSGYSDPYAFQKQSRHRAKQSTFVEYDVVGVVLTAITTHPVDVEGNLAELGFEVLLEMMNGGNHDVQTAILEHIKLDDKNKFLNFIRIRMMRFLSEVKDGFLTDSNRKEFEKCQVTFKFLRNMCEDHFLPGQEILRSQSASSSIDIVGIAVQTLLSQANTCMRALIKLEEGELVINILEVLTKMVQGPCTENQMMLVNTAGFSVSLEKLIHSNSYQSTLTLKVKTSALRLLSSLLEGRDDLSNHQVLATEFHPDGFKYVYNYAYTYNEENKISDGGMDHEIQILCKDLFACLKYVIQELKKIPSFSEKMDIIDRDKDKKLDFDHSVHTLEVSWLGRIHSICFPIPDQSDFLSVKTKEEFLLNADLSSSDKRMKQLMLNAPIFLCEMKHVQELSKDSSVYLFVDLNFTNLKWLLYALVISLNLNIFMASYGTGSQDGYPSISHGLNGLNKQEYAASLNISLVLALLVLLGYLVIVIFLAITDVPVIIRQIDEYVRSSQMNNYVDSNHEYRDTGPFTWWFVSLIFNVLFIFMHISNYPGNANQGLYLFLVFGINLPWTLSCVRNYIVIPDTPSTRIFCVIYDVLTTKSSLRNSILLVCCAATGFARSSWFAIMLLDIFSNSRILANISKAVTDNMLAFGLIFYVFVCTVAIYAQFGLEYFENWFTYDGDTDDAESVGCHSAVSCFVLIFYHGVPNGSLADVMDGISNRHVGVQGQDSNTYIQRVLFELSFYILVSIVLFNTIIGLMLDGFGSLREEDNIRQDRLENQCFVCGFTRSQYEDIPNLKLSFDDHNLEEHNMWKYVDFYVYLRLKLNRTTLSAVESYVWKHIENTVWIPSRSTAAIQNSSGANLDSNDITDPVTEEMRQDIMVIKQAIQTVEKKLSRA